MTRIEPARPRLGVYGGTFDPPHLAHLIVADRAVEALQLDELIWMPCGRPPLKDSAVASPEHRLAMCEVVCADRPDWSVSDLELRRSGPSYTWQTLEALRAARGPADWWWILGGDALADLPRWRRPERILELARLGVAQRPGATLAELAGGLPEWLLERCDAVDTPLLDIASRQLRADLAAGRSTRYLVPPRVAEYVAKHRLYGSA